jgi:voltage-gated potassium channel
MPTLRQRTNDILQIKLWRDKGHLKLLVNLVLAGLILLNTLAIILHSIPSLRQQYNQLFIDFELFSVVVFSVEYLLRLWSVVEQPAYQKPLSGRIRFALSSWGLIDLLSILPFYISLFHVDLGFIRVLRLLRMLRLFRLSRYFAAMKVISNVLKSKKEELLLCMVFILFLLFITSSLMYYLEHEAQPDKFVSIPAALWWGVNNMTTVGYGDVLPITTAGRILSGLFSIMGVAIFALPTGILASAFAEHWELHKKKDNNPS